MGLFGSKKVEENGLLKAYNVIYLGGWSYENAKKGQLELKIFEDRFEFLPNIVTKKWFSGLTIPYGTISDLQIVQRQVGTVEGILGGLNSRQLNQANNIHITYRSETGDDVLLRLEMLSGITVMGQAIKCREFEDLLRTHNILKSFCPSVSSGHSSDNKIADDIPSLIEKLSALRDKSIISEQEFESKKTELLLKM